MEVSDCLFRDNRSSAGAPGDVTASGGGAVRVGNDASVTIRGCVFDGNTALSGAAVHSKALRLIFEDNTVVRNVCESGAVVVRSDGESAVIRKNIFANNQSFGLFVGSASSAIPRVYCNAFWQNQGFNDSESREGGQWRAPIASGYDGADDYHSILIDPRLCEDDSLRVALDSPLASLGPPCGPVGGALGIGCVLSPTRKMSWGQIRSAFR